MKFKKPRLNVLVVFSLLFFTPCSLIAKQVNLQDSDGDGLSDQYEAKIGSESYLSDTDGDGIPDGIEIGKDIDNPLDSDADGRINVLDYDDDNDGLPTFLESKVDTDKDGVKDYLDQDSDNDGLSDGEEAGVFNHDSNHNGIDDAFDLSRSGAVDKNGDGIDDNLKLPDYNNDGIANYLDASFPRNDNKRITNKVKTESRLKEVTRNRLTTERSNEVTKKTKNKKVTKSVINRNTDADNDGLLDSQEKLFGTNPNKRDTDGDSVSDAIEIGLDINSPQDSDHDGKIDALDIDDDNDGVLTKLEDLNKDGSAINDDTDGDGVPNYLDGNDDGDNKLTLAEGFTKDSDKDGIPDYLDKDDGVKNKNVSLLLNTKIPNEPEVIVLFDSSKDTLLDAEVSDDLENDDTVKVTINDAVKNAQLDTRETNKPNKVIASSENNNPKKKRKSVLAAWTLF